MPPPATSRARRPALWWPRGALPWPAPALVAWLLAWLGWALVQRAGGSGAPALAAGVAIGALQAACWPATGRWRRLIIAAGFPVSALGTGLAQGLPAWAWLLPLALLLLAYPLRAWCDAPLFPTPPSALRGLAQVLPLPPGAALLDAGCGVGDGLRALRGNWPDARIDGVECSALLARVAALRCRFARVRRGDLWATDWSGYALVYLFQRPEAMAGAWAKARAEMAPGSWLASLAFAVPGEPPAAVLRRAGAQPVWLYRLPPRHRSGAQSARSMTDNPFTLPARRGNP